ncbi:hypothetical protein ACS0TY_007809 [Phlomoides rotata]
MFLCSFDHHVYISFLKVWVLKQMQPSLWHILSIGLHQSQIQGNYRFESYCYRTSREKLDWQNITFLSRNPRSIRLSTRFIDPKFNNFVEVSHYS